MATPPGSRPPLGPRGGGGARCAVRGLCEGGGGGGRARSMSATVLVALGGGRRRAAVGTVAAVARGCSGPPRCGRICPGATLGVALPEGEGGLGRVLPRRGLHQGPCFRGGRGGGSAPVLRPVPLAGSGGALLPPHLAALPRPPRRRRVPGGPASGYAPPPRWLGQQGVCGPPTHRVVRHPPRDPPISPVRRLALRGPGGAQVQSWGWVRAQHPGRSRTPARRRGARVGEGLRRWAGSPQPGGQRRCPCPPGLGYEHLAARRDPGRGHGAARAPRGARMAYVASAAAAADAPAQAPAAGTRRRPMLQAERALSAAARSWGAAALRRCERDAAGRGPRGPPGIGQQGRPPLRGAGDVIHEEAVTVLRSHARRRPQAPGPRVAAVRRQAHQL